MSEAQEQRLLEALRRAEALARVLRTESDGKIGLQPVFRHASFPPLPVNWGQAETEARLIARRGVTQVTPDQG